MKTFNKNSIVTLLSLFFVFGLVGPSNAFALSPLPVDLLTAGNFVILAGTPNITDSPTSVITGNVGLSPATGAGIGLISTQVAGTIYAVDAFGPVGSVNNAGLLTIAKNDLTTAYGDAAGRPVNATVATELGGTTKFPGVYDSVSTTFAITAGAGTLTLDAQGDPNAVFIFKMGSAGTGLIVGPGSIISLINGAQARNVFWVVDTATIDTTAAFKGNILALNSITVANGSNIEGRLLARNGNVTLINDVITIPTTLHVIKLVVNGNGGTAVPANFMIHVKSGVADVSGSPQAGTSTPGTMYSLSAGAYTVSEDANAFYLQSFSGACNSSGVVTLVAGDDKTCTIINTDIPVPVPVPAPVSSGGGGVSTPVVPVIGLTKIPTPLSLPLGTGPVTYNYTVWNVAGQQSLTVTLTDDKCGPIIFLSGDLNGNNKLDPTETWKYSCTMTLANTTTNTAVATGVSDDVYHQTAIATAIATVVVGSPLTPPLINVVKVPSRLTPFPFGGGNVVYTYTVTNPGTVAMHDVTVTDDKCALVSAHSGDVNNNNLLEPGESWVYTCQTNISVSTRNVATAVGSANGFNVTGYAFANVLVFGQVLGASTSTVPLLPSTGLPPEEKTIPWGVAMLAGIFTVLALVFIPRRKQII